MRTRFPLSALLLALVPRLGAAQTPAPLTPVETRVIASSALHENRTIDISTPDEYATSGRRYPVLIVLDGDFEFPAAAALARFYADVGQLPPMIVVGVRNTDRNRDFTPAAVAKFRVPGELRSAGGADNFLRFLSDELLPGIDRDYRTVPMHLLVGHSLGGLFALYSLSQKPTLFTGYLVMEPSTWWNNERELGEARRILSSPQAKHARVVMVNAPSLQADTTHWGDDAPMVRDIIIDNETHASMAAAGMMSGLRRLLEDFRPSEWRPGTPPAAMIDRVDSLSRRVGYTVPVEPTTYALVVRMSIDSREFGDAERLLNRWEKAFGASAESRQMRDKLAADRARPAPADFVPLVVPAARPTPAAARRLLGRWESIDASHPHWIEVTASADTIVVHDWQTQGDGSIYEGDRPVIQITSDGTLEWGLPVFRGIAGLLVLRGKLTTPDTMVVTREVRGWSPMGPSGDFKMKETMRRVR